MRKEYIVLGISILLLLAAGTWLYSMISQYRKAAGEYRELQEYVDDGPEKKNEDTEEAEETTVDFDALKEINPDIVAWIRIPEVLDYPVVQGEDNSYYLFHTFRGENNIAGSIFLDYRNSSDFTDGRSIIYGHNMKDGSMFHGLRKYQNVEFFQAHGRIQLFLPDEQMIEYKVKEFQEVRTDSDIYQLDDSERVNGELMLSTCGANSRYRLIIIAEEEKTKIKQTLC